MMNERSGEKMIGKDAGGENRRPAERVRHHILSHYDRPGLKDEIRLPSVRRLADQLKVSTATVQSIFQKLSSEGRIRTQVGNGSFLLASKRENEVLRIGVNIPVPQGSLPSVWAYRIYGGILHGAFQSGQLVALKPLPPEALENPGDAEKFLAGSREMNGFILFHSTFHRRLRQLCEEAGLPHVYLNPPSESTTANFVSPDYYAGSRFLGEVFCRSGRQRMAMLIWPSCEKSVSVRLRCAGMAAGMADSLGYDRSISIHLAADTDEEAGFHAMRALLQNSRKAPDAVYCAGDKLAHGAIGAIRERGMRIPDDIAVVGGNGLGRESHPAYRLTGMRQPHEQMGEELVTMLLERIQSGGASLPGRYLPVDFLSGSTTTKEENLLLNAPGRPSAMA